MVSEVSDKKSSWLTTEAHHKEEDADFKRKNNFSLTNSDMINSHLRAVSPAERIYNIKKALDCELEMHKTEVDDFAQAQDYSSKKQRILVEQRNIHRGHWLTDSYAGPL